MRESLYISNFAGIKELELSFTSINILIGPQASGKSVIVKLMYFFKKFFCEIKDGIERGENKRTIDNNQKAKFIKYFPTESWPKGSFTIKYQVDQVVFTIEKTRKSTLKFGYSDVLINTFNNYKKVFSNYKEQHQFSNILPKLNKQYYDQISEELSPISSNMQRFIPAGRSFFANIQANIFSLLSTNQSLDPFLIEFGAFYEQYKSLLQKRKLQKQSKDFDKIISTILKGKYIRKRDKDYLIHDDGRVINLLMASSGQQEILPLMIVLKAFHDYQVSENRGLSLYIEEPEAHLFPNAQKSIVQLLARTFNSNSNYQLFITTHSPYILAAFNNLIEAGRLNTHINGSGEKLYKIVPVEEMIDPKKIIAYSLNNSKKKSLINKSTSLISYNDLDAVSNDIAVQFEKLLDLEF